jgi:hypothetical protein
VQRRRGEHKIGRMSAAANYLRDAAEQLSAALPQPIVKIGRRCWPDTFDYGLYSPPDTFFRSSSVSSILFLSFVTRLSGDVGIFLPVAGFLSVQGFFAGMVNSFLMQAGRRVLRLPGRGSVTNDRVPMSRV